MFYEDLSAKHRHQIFLVELYRLAHLNSLHQYKPVRQLNVLNRKFRRLLLQIHRALMDR
jgi:hypothetical protein